LKSTKTICPTCTERVINKWRIALTAFGFSFPIKCEICGAYCSASANVKGNLLGLILISFVLSVALSIKHRSFLFYGVFAVTVIFSLLYSYYFAKPEIAAKPSIKGFIFLLIAAVVVFVIPHIVVLFLG
jgi:hypothetical protein